MCSQLRRMVGNSPPCVSPDSTCGRGRLVVKEIRDG
uniref:Uncharacterized protein n=1 Tax=Arundo donax TaxID=35708 RepID=A0A0A9GK56_ARUDO